MRDFTDITQTCHDQGWFSVAGRGVSPPHPRVNFPILLGSRSIHGYSTACHSPPLVPIFFFFTWRRAGSLYNSFFFYLEEGSFFIWNQNFWTSYFEFAILLVTCYHCHSFCLLVLPVGELGLGKSWHHTLS